jgi:hypothetical protein
VTDLEIKTNKLNALIIKGDTLKAVDLFYSENVSMQENEDIPRVGKKNCLDNEKINLDTVKKVVSKLLSQAIDNENKIVFSEWEIIFTTKDNQTISLKEVSVQKWDCDKIVSEKFYYKDFYPLI